MGDRGVAQVVDLDQARRRRGAQIGRGQLRRVNPRRRKPIVVTGPDWEKVAGMSPFERRRIARSLVPPPTRPTKTRRWRKPVPNPRPPWPRAMRRAAWKVERRQAGVKVAWPESRSAACELAPVVPFRHRRSLLGRLVASHGRRPAAVYLMDEGGEAA